MDCVRPLTPEEDDGNAWTIRNCLMSQWMVLKNPFRHTYGIRNAARPTKTPLFDTREAVATTTKMHATLVDHNAKSTATVGSSSNYHIVPPHGETANVETAMA
jgi:hypothetical protein